MIKLMRSVWLACAIANYLVVAVIVVLAFKSNVLPWWGFLLWGVGSFIFATVNLKVARTNEMWNL